MSLAEKRFGIMQRNCGLFQLIFNFNVFILANLPSVLSDVQVNMSASEDAVWRVFLPHLCWIWNVLLLESNWPKMFVISIIDNAMGLIKPHA